MFMNVFKRIKAFFYTLMGGMNYRTDNYELARKYLEKAIILNADDENIMLFQYYGHTLFRLEKFEESFPFLKRSYEKYNYNGWSVSNQEEYRLASETLKVLNYLSEHSHMKIDNFSLDKNILVRNP